MLTATLFNTPVVTPLLRSLSNLALKLLGWRIEGEIPEGLDKCVIIAAPHTTNWDLPFSLMVAFSLDMQIHWMGKASLFRFPCSKLMHWLGGIPVDRNQRGQLVDTMVETFGRSEKLRILLSPEGTRGEVAQWKSGFYHIANGAGVPIVMAFIDYRNKRAGVLDIHTPQGDYERELIAIQERYNTINSA